MRPRGRAEAAAAMSDINITPMIDVLLVLLIIFMVVTPVAQQAIDAKLPEQKVTDRNDSTPRALVLEIGAAGLSLNQSPVASLDDLDARLRSVLETRSDKTLFVRASGDVIYGTVVEALDVARGAGVDRIGVMGNATETQGAPAQ